MKSNLIPNHILKLMSKQDREALHQKTADELNALGVIKYERDLHKQISNLLRLRGIEFIESRMDRKTTQKRGVPDFLFATWFVETPPVIGSGLMRSAELAVQEPQRWPIASAWELKLPGRVLDPDQKAMFERLTKPPNAWCCRIIHSVDEALDELRKLGL